MGKKVILSVAFAVYLTIPWLVEKKSLEILQKRKESRM